MSDLCITIIVWLSRSSIVVVQSADVSAGSRGRHLILPITFYLIKVTNLVIVELYFINPTIESNISLFINASL